MPVTRSGRSLRVLVVDDNTQIHEDFRKALGSDGSDDELQALEAELFGDVPLPAAPAIEIVSCHQGEEARDRVAQDLDERPFALAFVDIRMPPGWDGIRTIEELWRVDPRLEIVICSAHSDYSWEEVAGRVGGTDQMLILKKPFELIEIRQISYALTRKWNLSRETEGTVERLEHEVLERTATLAHKASELENALSDLRRTQTQLIQSGRLTCIGQLAAGIAHEINTPLQYIGDNMLFLREAFASLLRVHEVQCKALDAGRAALDPALLAELDGITASVDVGHLLGEIPLALGEMQSGVGSVIKIVRSMKDFAHPGGTDLRPEDLNRAIESAVTFTRGEWKATAEVTVDLAPDLPEVPCLIGELNQVFLNLLINAVDAIAEKAAPEKGEIRIRTAHSADFAEIRIADTGCGIAEEIRDRIFDPFFTTKDVGKGTGQGLAIAWNVVVKNHHGSLEFESEVGGGTTFIVRLPLRVESGSGSEGRS